MLYENEVTEARRCFLLSFFARITAARLTSRCFVPCVHWLCPKSSVTGSCFPRVHINVAALEVRLQNVLVPLEGYSLITVPLLQLSVHQDLRDPVVLHSDDVSCPS